MENLIFFFGSSILIILAALCFNLHKELEEIKKFLKNKKPKLK